MDYPYYNISMRNQGETGFSIEFHINNEFGNESMEGDLVTLIKDYILGLPGVTYSSAVKSTVTNTSV